MATSFPYRIQTPAKVNLRLKITGRRPDGYHDLVTLMAPVGLCDDLTFTTASGSGICIRVQGYRVPVDEGNLVHRAAAGFYEQTGIREGVVIDMIKRIPVAAGLGGGSSDAAATLLALNRVHGTPLSRRDLFLLAVGLGADVPFFLDPHVSLATGIGEVLEPVEQWPDYVYIIVSPPVTVSTAWVYGQHTLELTTNEYDHMMTVLKKDPLVISYILENDLERVTSARFPIVNVIKAALREAGAEGALMTGSGPSVFGLFSSGDRAETALQAMKRHNLGEVFLAPSWKA